jgi:hypothetical protein
MVRPLVARRSLGRRCLSSPASAEGAREGDQVTNAGNGGGATERRHAGSPKIAAVRPAAGAPFGTTIVFRREKASRAV